MSLQGNNSCTSKMQVINTDEEQLLLVEMFVVLVLVPILDPLENFDGEAFWVCKAT